LALPLELWLAEETGVDRILCMSFPPFPKTQNQESAEPWESHLGIEREALISPSTTNKPEGTNSVFSFFVLSPFANVSTWILKKHKAPEV
jgi:hypothetical protein